MYKVRLTKKATDDLENPKAAQDTIDGIITVAEKLNQLPEKHELVKEDFIRKFAVRLTYYKNYNIFYQIENDIVYIVRIMYVRACSKSSKQDRYKSQLNHI